MVWDFANVHPRYQKELLRCIQYGDITELNEWKSVIHTRQTFELSVSVRHTNRLWLPFSSYDARIDQMLLTIMRDIAYAQNDIMFQKAEAIVPLPLLLIHAGTRAKIRSLVQLSRSPT